MVLKSRSTIGYIALHTVIYIRPYFVFVHVIFFPVCLGMLYFA